MSYLRNIGVSLAISLLCLTLGHETYAQSRARSRVVANRSHHQIAARDVNSRARQRRRASVNNRIHPANVVNDHTGLNLRLNNSAAIEGSGSAFVRNRAFAYPQA